MQIYQVRKLLALIIALACGALALLLLNTYLKQREARVDAKIRQILEQYTPAQPQQQVPVYVAIKDIPPQVPITLSDLTVKQIPVDYLQPQAVTTSPDEVVGQISSVPIAAGEQILKNKLMPPGTIGRNLAEITPEGKRAVNVLVDDASGIVNLIQPGDYIDVSVLISLPSDVQPSAEKPSPRLMLLFQGVKVLAVGGQFQATPSTKEQLRGSGTVGQAVTLALTPEEAGLLGFAQEQGKIKIALRSSQDTKPEQIKPVDWKALSEHLYGRKLMPASKQPMVEIYRGSSIERVPLSEKEK